MEYSKLVAVTGMPGLYELISTKNDGVRLTTRAQNLPHHESTIFLTWKV
jgi:hypothetical protein